LGQSRKSWQAERSQDQRPKPEAHIAGSVQVCEAAQEGEAQREGQEQEDASRIFMGSLSWSGHLYNSAGGIN